MVPYQALTERWHDYYIVTGTAAATLVGLLFVGLSLHLRAVLSGSEVRSLARVTLANFGLVLSVALFMEIPQRPNVAGIGLLVVGLWALVVLGTGLVRAARRRGRTMPTYRVVSRFALSALGYAGAVVAGVLVLNGSYGSAFNWLVGVTLLLLIVSLRNSWDLLVSVGEATLDREQSD
jgi:hypothetical protein